MENKIDEKTKQILLGSLLGDGSIFSNSKRSAYYQEIHSIKQKDYLLWKYRNLGKFLGLKSRTYKTFEKTQKKYYGKIRINSKSLPELLYYRKLFYPNGKKTVSNQILDQINKLGLALWYCDDGNYHIIGKTVRIMTDGFSFEEQKLIKNWFLKSWGISCKIIKRKTGSYYIQFDRKEADNFLKLIMNHVPLSMRYKLGHLLEENLDIINSALDRASKTHKKYYLKNNVRILERQNKYRKQPEIIKRERVIKQIYYKKNRDKILERCKKYAKKNKNIIRKRRAEYYKRNKDKISIRQRRYYIKNRGLILIKQKEYNKKPDIRERKKIYDKKRYISKMENRDEKKCCS